MVKKVPDATLPANNTKTRQVSTSAPALTRGELRIHRHRRGVVSLNTNTGDTVSFTLTTAMLIHMVNLSTSMLNNFTARVLGDLDVL